MKIFIITSRFYILCMQPLFVVAKIISPEKSDCLLFLQSCFKCDYDYNSTVVFGNARITL